MKKKTCVAIRAPRKGEAIMKKRICMTMQLHRTIEFIAWLDENDEVQIDENSINDCGYNVEPADVMESLFNNEDYIEELYEKVTTGER